MVASVPEICGPGAGNDRAVPGIECLPPDRLARHLPLSLLATIGVLVFPAALAGTLVPPRGVPSTLASGALAVFVSLLVARLGAAAWHARSRRSDLVFADLMVWGLARRWWMERRLGRLSAAYEHAARADLAVRVELLEAIALLLEVRSPYTYGHCRRVARHAERIAHAMHLMPAEVATIRTAALVHDVGKIYASPELLHKVEPLTHEETEIVMRHVADGARMLGLVKDPGLAAIVLHHHERFGGGGHPDGLLGEEIPLGARIVAVANAFDTLTKPRPGRPACSQHDALAALRAQSGMEFDGRVVETFEQCCSAQRSVLSLAFLTAVSERATGALKLPGGLGLTGTSTTAQMLPALGAAGLLALTPAIHPTPHRTHAPSPAPHTLQADNRPALLLQGSSTTQASGQGSQGSRPNAVPGHGEAARPERRSSGAPSGPAREGSPAPSSVGRAPSSAEQGAPSTSTPAQSASTTTTTSSAPQPSSPPPSREETQVPREAEPPPQQAPAITTPSITTPAISTPAISLPPVKLPPLNVPPITIPPVTVPPITLPGLKLTLGG